MKVTRRRQRTGVSMMIECGNMRSPQRRKKKEEWENATPASNVIRYDANMNVLEIIPVQKNHTKAVRYQKEQLKKPTYPELAVNRILKPICKKRGLAITKQHIVHYSKSFYILDFYINTIKLCVEVDGRQHNRTAAKAYDANREKVLQDLGITTVRISNLLVRTNRKQVQLTLQSAIDNLLTGLSRTNIVQLRVSKKP